MTAYLSAAWLQDARDPAAEALAATGATASIGRIVTGAPDGEARFTARVGGGVVVYEEGVSDDVDLSLTDTYANAVALLRGDEDANALFMRGRTKVAGNTGVLLDLLAATTSQSCAEERGRMLAALDL